MRLLEMPSCLKNKGIEWPKIAIVESPKDRIVEGMPYIVANYEEERLLLFRVLIPELEKSYPQFNWKRIYAEQAGSWQLDSANDMLMDLSMDFGSSIDLNALMELKMLPKFFGEIEDVVRTNVTNSYYWEDGYNKKTGLCTGQLLPAGEKKNLIILDISASIPDGLSAGLLTMLKTMTEVAHADAIITGGTSYFYTNTELRSLDIHEVREKIPKSNEFRMFNYILEHRNMNYENVIAFGDSDSPCMGSYDRIISQNSFNAKNFFNYFVGEKDQYWEPYTCLAGYGRWCVGKDTEIHHNYSWAKYFNDKYSM